MNKKKNFLETFRKLKFRSLRFSVHYLRYLFVTLFIFFGSLGYIFYVSDNCKSLKVFMAYKDLGFEQCNTMSVKGNLINKVKKVIKKSPLVFDMPEV